MTSYLVIKEAVQQFDITQYALRKAVKNGQVRHFMTKLLPMNIPVTMVCAEDIKTYKSLSENDFVPIGVISLKFNVHRSTMHYHRSTGAVRWQKRGTQIYVHRQDCENLFAQRGHNMREEQAVS